MTAQMTAATCPVYAVHAARVNDAVAVAFAALQAGDQSHFEATLDLLLRYGAGHLAQHLEDVQDADAECIGCTEFRRELESI